MEIQRALQNWYTKLPLLQNLAQVPCTSEILRVLSLSFSIVLHSEQDPVVQDSLFPKMLRVPQLQASFVIFLFVYLGPSLLVGGESDR